ncbi:coiled-coil domain-containing protein 162-like isoform X2 [Esox lucius]|uniref:coiled-coil domain-containing protein 162-like isoform X2 n=1 Tax=Esox lucius TaxID=8010 RepID=UPI001476D0F9|nr:coiled-coil domain-containing protein 162-like isoform X2 [Esox lucius]
MAQCGVRAQIIGMYSSLTALLDELPDIRQSHFLIGQAHELKGDMVLHPDPRKFQRRPRSLLSADGRTVLNLWFLPHYTEVLLMFKTLDDLACSQALHHTLEIVSGLHDIFYYLVTFARLGNPGDFSSRRRGAGQLTADWGGCEGIGAELWELQRQVDSLCDPGSPEAVARLLQLRRHVLFLQYDTAVRHLIREAFLSSGNVTAYQSVSDNMGHALPPLSDSVLTNHSSQLPLPQPLEPHSSLAQRMYPWRSFLTCYGLFPVDIWDIPPIENCLQLCLSGLGDRSRMEANGAILGMSLLMEDVLDSGGVGAAPIRLHDKKEEDSREKPEEEDVCSMDGGGAEEGNEEKKRVSFVPLKDPLQVQSVLKGFLLLTKQLEVFKESWGRRQLRVEQINTLKIFKQFSSLYRAEIQYPSMKALAQHMGEEKEFEALLSDNQPILPPAGASEVHIKTFQLLRLLESTECDMIRAVQRRITRELTLVTSERARQDTGLPTELWKQGPMKYSLSPERPQIVENFTHQLMEGVEEAEGGQLLIPRAHLQHCLSTLGCSVMERERRTFLLYSQFYEQILEQERQLLYHREQDVKSLEGSQCDTINPYSELSGLCRGMMMQTTTLRTRIAQLEEEQRGLQQQISLQYRQRYDSLVRQLFSTCIQLKARLEEYHAKMYRDVTQLVSQVRTEGVDNIIKLKKKFGSTKDNDALLTTQSKELHDLSRENCQMTDLLCKVKALSHWRRVAGQGKLHRGLLHSQQREMSCRREALKIKMMSEEEVILLKEELEVTQRAMAQCQRENNHTKRLLTKQRAELNEVSHRSAQEAQSRQELDSYRLQSLEQLREEVEHRDKQLRDLSAQLDRSDRERQLLRQRSAKDIRQVKGQLHQERCLKQEAFQWVGKLQSQAEDIEPSLSRITSTAGRSKSSCHTFPHNRSSIRGPDHSGPLQDGTKRDFNTQLERPKTEPLRLRILNTETLLPDLPVEGSTSSSLLTDLQQLRRNNQ